MCWNGVAHIDMRIDAEDGEVKIFELNSRFWGSILGSLRAGVNFPHLACLSALKIPFPKPCYKEGEIYFVRGISGRVEGRDDVPYSWRRSNIPFVLADPFPEITHRLRSLARRKSDAAL